MPTTNVDGRRYEQRDDGGRSLWAVVPADPAAIRFACKPKGGAAEVVEMPAGATEAKARAAFMRLKGYSFAEVEVSQEGSGQSGQDTAPAGRRVRRG